MHSAPPELESRSFIVLCCVLLRTVTRVDGFVGDSMGGVSGGTLASGANLLDNPQLLVRKSKVRGGRKGEVGRACVAWEACKLSSAQHEGWQQIVASLGKCIHQLRLPSAPFVYPYQGNQNDHCLDPDFPEINDRSGVQLVRALCNDWPFC